jgi:hypothetical protein
MQRSKIKLNSSELYNKISLQLVLTALLILLNDNGVYGELLNNVAIFVDLLDLTSKFMS